MNALTNFTTPFATALRVLNREGQPWFIAKDVCDALDTDTKDVRTNLDSAEVSTFKVPGQPGRPALIVSESGFYKLVLKSRKPEARRFQDWVTGVVLPAIRKDGGYILGEDPQSCAYKPGRACVAGGIIGEQHHSSAAA